MAIAEVSQSVSRSLREPDLSEVIVDPRRSDFHIQELVADRGEGPAARLRRHWAVSGDLAAFGCTGASKAGPLLPPAHARMLGERHHPGIGTEK